MTDIFLSHSSADNQAAEQLKAWLKRDRPNWDVFLDREDIYVGDDWHDRLDKALRRCRVVLALISEDWLSSPWCHTEATIAKFNDKDFFPLILPGLSREQLAEAPSLVDQRQHINFDFDNVETWQRILERLDRSGLDPDHWFSISDGVGPYPGSVAFEEKDAGVFFGRDEEITHYLEVLNQAKRPGQAQAIVISGGSGSGKSSLVKAGLIPRLKRKADWVVLSAFEPNREPLHRFLRCLQEASKDAGVPLDLPTTPPTTLDDLTTFLTAALRSLEDATPLGGDVNQSTVLITVDQAEALLASALSDPNGEAARLLDALGRLLASAARQIVVLFTIRTEFYSALEGYLPATVRPNASLLDPIRTLAEVIERPAKRFGIELGPGLVSQMVEDTRGSGGLPLLAYTLRELYEQCREEDELTLDAYKQLGGVEGAIEKKLGEALGTPKPTADELATLRRTLVHHLIRVDEAAIEGERFLRNSVLREQLPKGSEDLIKRLENARLISGSADGTVAIAHERLINDWQGLPIKTWLDEGRADRRALERLRFSLAEHQDGGPLLTGKPLDDALELRAKDASIIAEEPEVEAFISVSVEAREQEKQRLADEAAATQLRRTRQLIAASAAALILAATSIIATYFYFEANAQTRMLKKAQTFAAYIGVLDFEDKQRENIVKIAPDRYLADIQAVSGAKALTKQKKCALGLDAAFTCLEAGTTFTCDGETSRVPIMAPIPGGRFLMGSEKGQVIKASTSGKTVDIDELPSRLVDITPFDMAAHEVTVGEFCAFAADPDFQRLIDDEVEVYLAEGQRDIARRTGCFVKLGRDSAYYFEANWQSPGFAQSTNHPVTCVSWFEARAYARWLTAKANDGHIYRLPSEAEWSYAAGGREQAATRGHDYFWGDRIADGCGFANGPRRFCDSTRPAACEERDVCQTLTSGQCVAVGTCLQDDYPYTAPVGTFAPNAFGLHDTAGNVWEWVADWYHLTYDGAPLNGSPWVAVDERWPPPRRELEATPPEPKDAATISRSLRGGSWENLGAWRLADRGKQDPLLRANFTGFRLARSKPGSDP